MQNQQDILHVIANGESQTVEFKTSLAEQRQGLESLCGMINSDVAEGTVFFGIAPDGSVPGVEPGNLDSAQRSLSQRMRQTFDPPISPTVEVLDVEGWSVVALRAARVRSVPYHEYDGRAYLRVGTETRMLRLDEKAALRRARDRDSHNGPWRCDRCGSWVGMLSSILLTAEGPRRTYQCDCGGEFWLAQ